MRRTPDQTSSDAPDDLPPALLADLADLYVKPAVPRGIDERVRNDAVAHFARSARKSRPSRLLRWVGGGAAAAAAVVLGFQLLPHRGERPTVAFSARQEDSRPAAPPSTADIARGTASAEDVDRSGRVDILDAFAIARALRSQAGAPSTWDVDGDGQVDQRDVDRVAADAVRVKKIASAQGRRAPSSSGEVVSHADVESGGTIR